MEKECRRCACFTAYYEKAYSCFLRTNCGKCSLKKTTLEKQGTCESFRGRSRRKRDKELVISDLNNALLSISAIKLILEEEEE